MLSYIAREWLPPYSISWNFEATSERDTELCSSSSIAMEKCVYYWNTRLQRTFNLHIALFIFTTVLCWSGPTIAGMFEGIVPIFTQSADEEVVCSFVTIFDDITYKA